MAWHKNKYRTVWHNDDLVYKVWKPEDAKTYRVCHAGADHAVEASPKLFRSLEAAQCFAEKL